MNHYVSASVHLPLDHTFVRCLVQGVAQIVLRHRSCYRFVLNYLRFRLDAFFLRPSLSGSMPRGAV